MKRITDALEETRPVKKQPKAPVFKLPKSDAQAADMLYELRQERLALQKQVDELKKKETKLTQHFLDKLPNSDTTGIAGRIARVSVEMKDYVEVTDWDKVYAAIVADYNSRKRNKAEAFLVMQKRVSDGTVKEMLGKGEKLAGMKMAKAPTISCTKVK